MAHFYEFARTHIQSTTRRWKRDQGKALFSGLRPSPGLWPAVAEAIVVEVMAAMTAVAAAPVAVAVPDAEVIAAVAAVASSLHLLE